MNSEIAQIPLAPIATVVAALITAVISFVNLTLSKEQKTSEFRQAWIDGLRGDLAIFFSSARALCRTMQETRSPTAIQSIIKIQQSEPLPFYSAYTLASPWLESAVLRYQSG
jgi:hypothetical protein